MSIKSLLWAEGEDAAMALTMVDAMAAPDVVGADMTVAADTGSVTMTVVDVVIAPQTRTPQTHTSSAPKNDQGRPERQQGSSGKIRQETHL